MSNQFGPARRAHSKKVIDRGYTYSEEFRAQCEAEYVCKIPLIADRREYLKGVQERRGKPARDQLEKKMLDVMNERTERKKVG